MNESLNLPCASRSSVEIEERKRRGLVKLESSIDKMYKRCAMLGWTPVTRLLTAALKKEYSWSLFEACRIIADEQENAIRRSRRRRGHVIVKRDRDGFVVSGRTFLIKESLTRSEFKFNPTLLQWERPGSCDSFFPALVFCAEKQGLSVEKYVGDVEMDDSSM